jgi:hypothetical protein
VTPVLCPIVIPAKAGIQPLFPGTKKPALGAGFRLSVCFASRELRPSTHPAVLNNKKIGIKGFGFHGRKDKPARVE